MYRNCKKSAREEQPWWRDARKRRAPEKGERAMKNRAMEKRAYDRGRDAMMEKEDLERGDCEECAHGKQQKRRRSCKGEETASSQRGHVGRA